MPRTNLLLMKRRITQEKSEATNTVAESLANDTLSEIEAEMRAVNQSTPKYSGATKGSPILQRAVAVNRELSVLENAKQELEEKREMGIATEDEELALTVIEKTQEIVEYSQSWTTSPSDYLPIMEKQELGVELTDAEKIKIARAKHLGETLEWFRKQVNNFFTGIANFFAGIGQFFINLFGGIITFFKILFWVIIVIIVLYIYCLWKGSR